MADTPVSIKPGYQTTEFWLHLLTQIGGAVITFLPESSPYQKWAGMLVLVANPAVWTWCRYNLKKIAMDAGNAAVNAVVTDIQQAQSAPATSPVHVTINTAPATTASLPQNMGIASDPKAAPGTAPAKV